ncbi:MAG: hypothetical protein IBX56_06625 [Methylomicrobium sp.]|nr:hypothetical protein [Methylomicrobium sp.]
MSYQKNLSVGLFFLLTLGLSIATISKTASANVLPSADSLGVLGSACPSGPDRHPELSDLKKRIAASETVDKARAIALAPTDEAIGALKNARTIIPFSDDLQIAENRLSDARNRILLASSQEQVADEFSGMMLAALDDDRVAGVDLGKVSCHYSTGEVIAIVIGLILGIIPGLILLIVLC